MSDDKPIGQLRTEAFLKWSGTQTIRGMGQEALRQILDHVRCSQRSDGSWRQEGADWDVAMTAVTLRGLSRIGFQAEDKWPCGSYQGGISIAINYLHSQLEHKKLSEVGEDIWDACQAALALKSLRVDTSNNFVEEMNTDWNALYAGQKKDNRWYGPAYLAAIIDVLIAYDDVLQGRSQAKEALEELCKIETRIDKTLGYFPARNGQPNLNRWNTSLVLRTLCSVDAHRREFVDPKLVQRLCVWLLNELQQSGWEADSAEAPMFYARCASGLYAARRWIGEPLFTKIDTATFKINRSLEDAWRKKAGNLKSYTAVAEYLSLWTQPVPTGLLLDVAESIKSGTVATVAIPDARTPPPDLKPPEKVTISWLVKHVPVMLWVAAGTLLFSIFAAGIKASDVSFIREIAGLKKIAHTDCVGLSSTEGKRKAKVNFKNFSNRTVLAYWVNYDGAEKHSFTLASKGEHLQETFVTHSWCIRDGGDGQPVLAVTVKSEDQDIVIP